MLKSTKQALLVVEFNAALNSSKNGKIVRRLPKFINFKSQFKSVQIFVQLPLVREGGDKNGLPEIQRRVHPLVWKVQCLCWCYYTLV